MHAQKTGLESSLSWIASPTCSTMCWVNRAVVQWQTDGTTERYRNSSLPGINLRDSSLSVSDPGLFLCNNHLIALCTALLWLFTYITFRTFCLLSCLYQIFLVSCFLCPFVVFLLLDNLNMSCCRNKKQLPLGLIKEFWSWLKSMGRAYATVLEVVGVINDRDSGNNTLNESHSLI